MEAEVKASTAKEAEEYYKSVSNTLRALEQAIVGMTQNMTGGAMISPQIMLVFLAGLRAWAVLVHAQTQAVYVYFSVQRERDGGLMVQYKERITELEKNLKDLQESFEERLRNT